MPAVSDVTDSHLLLFLVNDVQHPPVPHDVRRVHPFEGRIQLPTNPARVGAEWSGDEIRHPDRDVHRERFGQARRADRFSATS